MSPSVSPALPPIPADFELPPRLKVDGPLIRKPNGSEFHPVGVSWGSWGKNFVGDAEANQAIGCNLIRDLLRLWGLYGSAEIDALDFNAYAFISRSHLQKFIEELQWITGAGMWAGPAIDSNCAQSGTQNADMRRHCDPYGVFGSAGRNIYSDRPMLKVFCGMWQSLARILRTMLRIAWYEIHPEPLPGRGPEWAPLLRDVQRQIIEAIREVDKDTPILLGARNAYDASLLDEVYMPDRNDVIYTGNVLSGRMTNPEKLAKALDDMERFRDRHGVPVWWNQYGRRTGQDRDLAHMRSALTQTNARRIGFAWWQNAQNSTDPDEYALRYPDGEGGWITKQNEVDCLTEFLQAARHATPAN